MAAKQGNAYSEGLQLLRSTRDELVTDVGWASSNWSGIASSLSAKAKLVSDLVLDLTGPAGRTARAAMTPLSTLAQVVRAGSTGESGSTTAMSQVVAEAMRRDALRELRRLSPIGGAFANLANNTRILAVTADGWLRLRSEYQRQLAALDVVLRETTQSLERARAAQVGLEEAKQAIDAGLRRCGPQ